MGLGSANPLKTETFDFEFFSTVLGKTVWVDVVVKTRDNEVVLCDVVSIFTEFSEDVLKKYEENPHLQKEVKNKFTRIRGELCQEQNLI